MAGDLYRMLTRYAERRGFQVSSRWGRRGRDHLRGQGRRRVLGLQVRGRHAPRPARARHRVGRAHPHLDRDGRGAAEAEDVDVEVDPNDLEIDVYRSSGPGGQSVNTTDSAVRITHQPTASSSPCRTRSPSCRTARGDARPARAPVRARARRAAGRARRRPPRPGRHRRRAEKIRTYNFPRAPVTDHRIKLTTHNLDQVLEGELDDFTAALADEEKRRRLAAQAPRPVTPGAACRCATRWTRRSLAPPPRCSTAGCDPALDAELLLAGRWASTARR